ncbi:MULTISPECIES: tryptophan--tRNA ligase [unclassified Fusibacter]|uniref:tryptophan--tRNA ligase n=1 Tax=unclassified Fusibacter TaxID=2624464 RepID=UPI001011652D|nr:MULTISPECIES: tryptophan--tRNA ligase [unclassified Fusibacter]MCK8059268.1 tryptophan--tRNA ligase [Fusibacter sp. A2]NPE21268.1 tryptophan--tRNA ligase [Fusibacter sp. A1]RXV62533.1 tryptophan--tRNA ligase [Fusibacter sp. A1]
MEAKKRIFSGIKPSGRLTLGNYIGAINNWVKMQEDFDAIYCVVDMHAITERQEPAMLRKLTLESLAQYIACGLDPKENTLFIQSHVPEHAELAWVLNCMTYMGELSRMTQYKDKSKKNVENLNAGLFTYPTLMAADILLYQTDVVPVGDDQKQHLELARDIAIRFNNRYSETFVVPEVYNPKVGARIMSLQEPQNKMAKSDDNDNASIYIVDSPDDIMRKLKRSVTDSVGIVQVSDDQPGIKNLLSIYSALSDEKMEDIVSRFEGKGYGEFKTEVAEVIIESLRPTRDRYDELMKNKDYLKEVYTDGANRAQDLARKTLRKVYKKTGFIPRG